jgi:hypothetical protein
MPRLVTCGQLSLANRKEISPVDELDFFNPFDEARPIKFKLKDKNVALVIIAFHPLSPLELAPFAQ